MGRQEALNQYAYALGLGKKEYKERVNRGRNPHPEVLDEVIDDITADSCQYVGLVEIPANRIVGMKNEGRTSAFSAGFLPLLGADTEFATKWVSLCQAHLDEGIRDPIVCYEYLGNFYVQEGNKRVSVLKSYGALRIPGTVYRILPPRSEETHIKAYYEFIEFYKRTGLYDIQFTQPGGYAKLSAALDLDTNQMWPEDVLLRFRACYQRFKEAFFALAKEEEKETIQPEDALLLWLKLYTYEELGEMNASELKKSLNKIWDNVAVLSEPEPEVRTEPPEESKSNLLTKIIRPDKMIWPDHIRVAFVHKRTADTSLWTMSHEKGRLYLEEALGKSVTTKSYFHANTSEQTEEILEQAVEEGADVIFTTAPQHIADSLKLSVKYPKVKVLNCSVCMPYSTVRTYYSRIYEGKFITGAIAGALADNNRIGYVGSYPIFGVPASINAFALGAQMTNPRAVIEVKWACMKGNPTQEFLDSGIRVISNRDTPDADRIYTEYGTYLYGLDGEKRPLASPVWVWGRFYENVVRSILSGSWESDKPGKAVNYWWGMSSGVIDLTMSEFLPEGVRNLAVILQNGLKNGAIDPFYREILAQDGTVKNDGTSTIPPEELLHMNWLCENVKGHIPAQDEVRPYARSMIELLGIRREGME